MRAFLDQNNQLFYKDEKKDRKKGKNNELRE